MHARARDCLSLDLAGAESRLRCPPAVRLPVPHDLVPSVSPLTSLTLTLLTLRLSFGF